MIFGSNGLVAAPLDELPLDRWKDLRETERYQMQIAEKYYREQNWKIAAGEYEKFITLHEKSSGSAFAQMKWSICQVRLKKLNTAIKDGFQSVIDYWPESPDAMVSAYYIGHTYKDMGEIKQAKKAYQQVLQKYPKASVAAYAAVDLIDLATLEDDKQTLNTLWKKLTFDTERTNDTRSICENASRQYASHSLYHGGLSEAVKSLSTTYVETSQLVDQLVVLSIQAINQLMQDEKNRTQAEKLADDAINHVRGAMPADISTPEQKLFSQNCWFAIARLYDATKRPEQSDETYKLTLEKLGRNDEILAEYARWRKTQGKYEEARQLYASYENKIEGLSQIAYSFREQQKWPEAIAVYQQLAGMDAERQFDWLSQAASTHRQAHEWMQAINIYQELMAKDADRADSWLWEIAYTYRISGQYKEAIGYYRQCNNFPGNYQEMAICHRALKEYGEAIVLYNQIVGTDENWAPWAMIQIGYTREEAEQTEQAIKAFQQVCKRFPKNQYASQAHAHLQTKYKITVTLGGAKDE
ncbi:MAG: tetratricopeptide repeat protein [Planctomycetota bacterium]|nr:tetratricopeptide repeat protein [Planctomycetota bacterium]